VCGGIIDNLPCIQAAVLVRDGKEHAPAIEQIEAFDCLIASGPSPAMLRTVSEGMRTQSARSLHGSCSKKESQERVMNMH
jgi:hypothetical protein